MCPQSLQSSGHPELLERLNKTIGFGIGLEFREGEYVHSLQHAIHVSTELHWDLHSRYFSHPYSRMSL